MDWEKGRTAAWGALGAAVRAEWWLLASLTLERTYCPDGLCVCASVCVQGCVCVHVSAREKCAKTGFDFPLRVDIHIAKVFGMLSNLINLVDSAFCCLPVCFLSILFAQCKQVESVRQ